MSDFYLNPGELSLNVIGDFIKRNPKLLLSSNCLKGIHESVAAVNGVIESGDVIYGINTGFGRLASTQINAQDLALLQRNIVLSHACGTGVLLEDEVVKLIMLLKINSLARGYSGIRLEVIQLLLDMLNTGVYPCIPSKGSVGASGDLVPLAHLSLPLIGEGEVRINNEVMSAEEGLKSVGLSPLRLQAKEGLALLNGMQVSTAMALMALIQAETLFESAVLAGSLSVDAAMGSVVPFDDRIHRVRGHQSQIDVAAMYRELLHDSEIGASHKRCGRIQDPYSLRCQPQVMGAVHHQLQFVGHTLQVEANAVSDNPLVFAEQRDILSGGNFHGEIVAMACDNLALGIAEIGALSERRIALLIDSNFSQLPAFLVKQGGLNSGFMLAHVTAASCASDNKALSHPHCVDSLPTSANQEDHVSMATNAARRLNTMLDNTATIIAIELLAACQGLEFHKPLKSSAKLQEVYEKVRTYVEAYEQDRYFSPDIEIIKQLVIEGEFGMS